MIRIKNNLTPRLPNEYQEVEYIQSTGTQCIDTGIPLNQYRKCEMEFSTTSIGKTQIIDGGYTNTSEQNDTRNYLRIDSDGMLNLQYARSNTSYKLSSVVIASNTKYAISYKMLASSCSLTVNGAEYSNLIGVTLITNGNNVFLFGESFKDKNLTKTYEASAFIKLYTAKYYDSNDILIRNFIPCYRKLDNEVGLYDLVNNVFYTNAGTGVFLMGEAVGTADVNLKPLIGNKKVLKRYIGENLVYGKETMSDIIVTREILDKGTFRNVAPVYLTNQIDGSDGFTIVGRGNVRNGSNQWEKYLAWTYTIDLTDYINIKFYAKKNANHGTVLLAILDEIKSGVSPLKRVGKGYASCPTTWTEYELDVSDLVGTKTLFFLGGYYDMTGNASSSTSYCNIRILK